MSTQNKAVRRPEVHWDQSSNAKANATTTLIENVFCYAARLNELGAADEVLAELGRAVHGVTPLKVLGAARIPLNPRDWLTAKLGETVFLSESAPQEWWQEYSVLCKTHDDQDLMMARSSLAAFTWTESRRMLEPLGIDRWPYDLALKHGMRDGLTCPVGRRWIVAFWSSKLLEKCWAQESRAMVFLAANFAAIRLEQLTPSNANRVPKRVRLTPRELAVLRLSSFGRQAAETGEALGLGEETVRSHLRKAQQKLGARNRTQAVAEALRQHLIP